MHLKHTFSFVMIFLLSFSCLHAQSPDTVIYKEVEGDDLWIAMDYPAEMKADSLYPALVFFHGGGWNGGNPSQFEEHGEYFAKRGLVCFHVRYRLKQTHAATPFQCLEDAKSAMRYIKANAATFQIDTGKVIASGGSAGGHLAAATALVEGYDDPDDPMEISPKPAALVLFNPVFDNGPGGYGYGRVGEEYPDFSPLHNIRKGAPPTIVFLGTEDKLIPVVTAEYYKMVMDNVGSRCELRIYEGQQHGFFNYRAPEFYQKTVLEADWFLQSLGYLQGKPDVGE